MTEWRACHFYTRNSNDSFLYQPFRYPMEKRILYSENVPAYGMATIFLAIFLGMVFSLYHQATYGPIGSKPAPDAFYVAGAIAALLIGLNFSAIRIRLTDVDVAVSYGLFGKTLAWNDVASCEIDAGAVLRYGGWGIRLGRIRGKTVWVYNTFGGTRVAFLPKGSRRSGLVVSTRNPEQLMRMSNELIGLQR
jgi:hypothetical protein